MKHIFVFAASVGLSAALASAAAAQQGNAIAPQAPAGNGQNLFGETAPNQNVVQPDQPRGQLGGLASGAPSFAANLKDLRGAPGAASATLAQAVQQPAGAPIANGQAVAVEKQTITFAQSFDQVMQVIHHCMRNSRPRKLAHLATPFGPVHGGWGPGIPAAVTSPGDLELLNVGMISDATGEQGPLYRITLRNNSQTPSRHFEVSLIAVRGLLSHNSPVVAVHVDEVPIGGTHEIDVQLPPGVMSLGAANHAAPFETLVVAIDSFDDLLETNELNNVAILTRSEIAILEVATTATAAPAPAAAVEAPSAPVGNATAPAFVAPSEAAPGDAAPVDSAQPNVAPQAPAVGNAAPAESAPPASSGDNDLESLVPENNDSGM